MDHIFDISMKEFYVKLLDIDPPCNAAIKMLLIEIICDIDIRLHRKIS